VDELGEAATSPNPRSSDLLLFFNQSQFTAVSACARSKPGKEMDAGAGQSQSQDTSAQQETRGVEKQASEKHYDAEADEEDVAVEMITGGGETHTVTLSPNATILVLKQQVERDAGFKCAGVKLYVHDDSREEALENGETLGSLRRQKGMAVLITLMVHTPDAQEVVAGLAAEADLVLGDGTRGTGDGQLYDPRGVTFVPAHSDWVVTTEYATTRREPQRVKISNIRTGALICKFGSKCGSGEGQFYQPWGVTVTSDSSFVVIADYDNHRIKVLRLVVAADGSSAHLEFIRHIGFGYAYLSDSEEEEQEEEQEEGYLKSPTSVALLPGEGGGHETVLVADNNYRVSQFKLDGTFIRIFAGTRGSGDGEFDCPSGITVLGSSEEVAVTDFGNHRVQIFDREGKYKRQFGSEGKEDGHFYGPAALTSDAHGNLLVLDTTNRLQVFSPEGKHVCTRKDLGVQCQVKRPSKAAKGIAWSGVGELAIANGHGNQALIWRNE
jgi:tripartite motif-containing protein 2/3